MIFQSVIGPAPWAGPGREVAEGAGRLPRCLLPWPCQLLCDDLRASCLSLDSEEVSWFMWPVQVLHAS